MAAILSDLSVNNSSYRLHPGRQHKITQVILKTPAVGALEAVIRHGLAARELDKPQWVEFAL